MTKRRSRVQTARKKIQRNQFRTQQYEDKWSWKLAVTIRVKLLGSFSRVNCKLTPSSRLNPLKGRKKPAVPMRVSSRGLWEHSRLSKHHKGTLSFFSQLGKNCCESHVLRDRTSRPSTSRTVPVHQNRDKCCQHKKRRESPKHLAAPLLFTNCTKVTIRPHAPPDFWRYPFTLVCDRLTSPVSDFIVQKSCAVSSAVAMLRKRLPPFEELRLDEEVATYTSVCVSAATGFVPPQPRCGNPLAAMLHFEESSVSTLLLTCREKIWNLQSEIINIYLWIYVKMLIPPIKWWQFESKSSLESEKKMFYEPS